MFFDIGAETAGPKIVQWPRKDYTGLFFDIGAETDMQTIRIITPIRHKPTSFFENRFSAQNP